MGGGETHALSLFSSNRTVARLLKQTPLYCSAPVPFKTISWSVHRTWFDLICNIYLVKLWLRNKSVIERGYLLMAYLYTFQSYTKNLNPCRFFYDCHHFSPNYISFRYHWMVQIMLWRVFISWKVVLIVGFQKRIQS